MVGPIRKRRKTYKHLPLGLMGKKFPQGIKDSIKNGSVSGWGKQGQIVKIKTLPKKERGGGNMNPATSTQGMGFTSNNKVSTLNQKRGRTRVIGVGGSSHDSWGVLGKLWRGK